MDGHEPFDRAARRRLRDRAAPRFGDFAFLKDAMADDIVERLDALGPAPLRILDLGAHDGRFAARLPGITVIAADAGFRFARAAQGVMCDEDRLPFAAAAFDAVLSAGSLHGVNDLPGALVQIRQCLRAGGVFVASYVGGASLHDIRTQMLAVELEARGGVSPRILPMVDPREAPSLMQRAGFVDVVVDVTERPVRYQGAAAMLRDLRGMGETNFLLSRSRRPLRRDEAARMAAAIEAERAADGGITARLQIITMTGRSPKA